MAEEMQPGEVLVVLIKAHEHMQAAFEELAKVHGRAGGLTVDSAFACGEALGVISKAKAFLGRAIDERRHG